MEGLKPCQMTADEAITILERIAHTESNWPGTEDSLTALDMAINTLRSSVPENDPLTLEQVVEKRGEPLWYQPIKCGQDTPFDNDPA